MVRAIRQHTVWKFENFSQILYVKINLYQSWYRCSELNLSKSKFRNIYHHNANRLGLSDLLGEMWVAEKCLTFHTVLQITYLLGRAAEKRSCQKQAWLEEKIETCWLTENEFNIFFHSILKITRLKTSGRSRCLFKPEKFKNFKIQKRW